MAIAEKGPNHNFAQRITDLETAVQKLSTQDVLLNATFGPGLTVEQAYNLLLGSIANATLPQVGSGSNTSYLLTTSYQTIASFNFTVPAGYTRALIAAQGTVTTGSTSADNFFVRVLINGAAGPESAALTGASNYLYSTPAFSSASLTGLTAGAAISIAIQAHLTAGSGASLPAAERSSVTGTALFLP